MSRYLLPEAAHSENAGPPETTSGKNDKLSGKTEFFPRTFFRGNEANVVGRGKKFWGAHRSHPSGLANCGCPAGGFALEVPGQLIRHRKLDHEENRSRRKKLDSRLQAHALRRAVPAEADKVVPTQKRVHLMPRGPLPRLPV